MSGPSDDTDIEVHAVATDPTSHGYSVAWNYSTRFWLSLLGPVPCCVWQTLLSFCYGHTDICWPSINLIADICANGNRHAITGRSRGRGAKRRRQVGALEILENAGVLSIETNHSGRQTRYVFHLLREPPLLTLDQLSQLPPRIQRPHADLLARCNIDHATYQHRVQNLRPRGVQDTTTCVQGTTPGVQDTSNHYKEQLQIEEVLRTIKDALSREMNSLNYDTYVSRLRPLHFRPDTACLTVETSSPLIAAQLNGQLSMLLRRTLASLEPKISGVQVHELVAVPGPPQARPTPGTPTTTNPTHPRGPARVPARPAVLTTSRTPLLPLGHRPVHREAPNWTPGHAALVLQEVQRADAAASPDTRDLPRRA